MSLTGYCDECGLEPLGITASMTSTRDGIVACGSSYPFGTKFIVEDMDTVFECEDRGGGITDDRLDIWFPTCQAALEFGTRRRWVKSYRKVRYTRDRYFHRYCALLRRKATKRFSLRGEKVDK